MYQVLLSDRGRDALEFARTFLGMTQARLGRYVGINEAEISLIETGKRKCSLAKIVKLQDFLNGKLRERTARNEKSIPEIDLTCDCIRVRKSVRVLVEKLDPLSRSIQRYVADAFDPRRLIAAGNSCVALVQAGYHGSKDLLGIPLLIAIQTGAFCWYSALMLATAGESGDDRHLLRLLQFAGVSLVVEHLVFFLKVRGVVVPTLRAIAFVLAYCGINFVIGAYAGTGIARLILELVPSAKQHSNALTTLTHSTLLVLACVPTFLWMSRATQEIRDFSELFARLCGGRTDLASAAIGLAAITVAT